MANYFTRPVAGAIVVLVAAMAAIAQQQDNRRSEDVQPDDRATNRTSDDRQQSGAGARRDDQRGQSYGDQNRRDEQSRRDNRQQRRESRGGVFSDRDGAIGVTVVERGGLGVRVTRVMPRSPAAEAGIEPGDAIIEVDGRRVSTAPQLVSIIRNREEGDAAELAVLRDGREHTLHVRVSTRGEAIPRRFEQQQPRGQRLRQFGRVAERWQQQPDDQQQYGRTGEYSPDQQGYRQGGQVAQPQQGRQRESRFWQERSGDQQGQWDQPQQYGQRQYDQRQFYDPQPSPQRGQSNDEYQYQNQPSGSRQTNYGGPAQASWTERVEDDQWRLGDRLAQRLERLENRLEELAERLDQVQGQFGSEAESRPMPSRPSGQGEGDD